MLYEITATEEFTRWQSKLNDRLAAKAIAMRLIRAATGNFGDHASVGDSVSELRIFVGKGYRVYYTVEGRNVIILLCGGHKGTQSKDIKRAKALLSNLENH